MLWLVKIWQVNSCVKFMQHLKRCLLWQLKLTEFRVNLWCFSTGCKKWNTAAIKSILLFMAGLFIGSLVEKCVACQTDNPISDGIVFVFHLAGCVRELWRLKRSLPYFIAVRSCISKYGKPWVIIAFTSNFMKSSGAVYEASLCTFVLRFDWDTDLT